MQRLVTLFDQGELSRTAACRAAEALGAETYRELPEAQDSAPQHVVRTRPLLDCSESSGATLR
jgi:hypothetical protein